MGREGRKTSLCVGRIDEDHAVAVSVLSHGTIRNVTLIWVAMTLRTESSCQPSPEMHRMTLLNRIFAPFVSL
jgi:hypothetical protein